VTLIIAYISLFATSATEKEEKKKEKLEGTRSRIRTHADDWLRHLVNVNEARIRSIRKTADDW